MGILASVMRASTIVNPPSADSSMATIGLKTSGQAMSTLAKGGIKSTNQMKGLVGNLNGKTITPDVARSLSVQLATIETGAELLKDIGPRISKAAKAYKEGEKARIKALEDVGTATQDVAVMNSEAQSNMFVGHVQASNEIAGSQQRSRMWGGV